MSARRLLIKEIGKCFPCFRKDKVAINTRTIESKFGRTKKRVEPLAYGSSCFHSCFELILQNKIIASKSTFLTLGKRELKQIVTELYLAFLC